MRGMMKKTHGGSVVAIGVLLAAMALGGPATAQSRSTEQSAIERSDGMVQLDFDDVELTVIIDTIAKLSGKNFIYDDRVRGRVTIVSPTPVTADEAYAVFESVLKVKGFTAVPGPGGVLKIIPVRDAKESSIETVKDGRPSANRDHFVTRLIPLFFIDADAITTTIKPLVSKDASMVAYGPTNTIILTDTAANIRRLLGILEAIDVETHKEELAVIKVLYADAGTLGQQISDIYGASVSAGGAASA
jgi:general secretion pathway protein D